MGENSIINIPESRVNDWELERQSVVCDFSRLTEQRRYKIARIAIGVDRRDIDNDLASTFAEVGLSGHRRLGDNNRKFLSISIPIVSKERRKTVENKGRVEALGREIGRREKGRNKFESKKEKVEEEKEVEKTRLRKYRTVASQSRAFLSTTVSSRPGLIQRIFLLLLSLLSTRFSSLFPSSQQFSSSASRGPVLVSGSFFALVSLLVVVLLRPTMAIPAVATAASDSGASGGTSTSTTNPTFNETNAALARIIQRSKNSVVIDEDDEEEARDDEVLNFESVATTTKLRRRRNVEYVSRVQLSNGDEQEEEQEDRLQLQQRQDDDDEDDDEQEENDDEDEEDAFPASFIPRTSESGREMRSRLHEAELETIRRSIVEGLGLERIPDPSKANVSQTEYRRAHEEYLTRLQHSRDSGDGRQRRLHTFHPAERSPLTTIDRKRRSISGQWNNNDEESSSKRKRNILYFPIVIPDEDSQVDHASLRLLFDPSDAAIETSNHVVSVYRIVAPNSREFVSREIFSNYKEKGPRWIEIDATKLANLWQEENLDHLGIELIFESIVNGMSFRPMEKQPLVVHPALNIFTTSFPLNEDFRGFRRKRRANPEHLMSLHKGRRTECRGENKKCCRHEMTVVFKDLKGFEFIIQPKIFDAGYCKGRCPPRYNPAHHHALLQSLIWKEDKRKAPRPCCAPSKLDEIEILYFDENDSTKLKISSWKNMKVLECACS